MGADDLTGADTCLLSCLLPCLAALLTNDGAKEGCGARLAPVRPDGCASVFMAAGMEWIYALALGYALGSVPFGSFRTRSTGRAISRAIGSGNIGATNVLRTYRKAGRRHAAVGPGLAAVSLAWHLLPGAAGEAAALGVDQALLPVWLGFRGGKGVATPMGVSLGLAWPIGLAYAVAWLGLLAVARISLLAGMTAAVVAPLAALATGNERFASVLGLLALLVLWLHQYNTCPRAAPNRKGGSNSRGR